MTEFIELLKYVLPAVVVFLAVYFFQRLRIKEEISKERYKLAAANIGIMTPLRLQAYERLSLLLERLSLESLILRHQNSEITARQFQSLILHTIRSEFDHNLSQQVYVSSNLWAAVRNAKEILIKTINITASQFPKEIPVNEFSVKLFEAYSELATDPLHNTSEMLKNEVREYFKI
jgi:hypothetical protein